MVATMGAKLPTKKYLKMAALAAAWEEFRGGLAPDKESLKAMIDDTKASLLALSYRADFGCVLRLLQQDLEDLQSCYRNTYG